MRARNAPVPWARRAFASLRRPVYRHYYIGLLFSFAGFWMRIAATGWFVYEETGSHERLGVITAASLLPWVPIAPWAGVVADRVDQRLLLVYTFAGVTVLNALLGIGILLGAVGWTELFWATVLIGCLHGVIAPTRHAIVRRLVPVSSLGNAIGLSAAGFHCMHAVGFAAAGFVYALGGAGACFIAVACATLVMIALLLRLRLPTRAVSLGRAHPWRELLAGFSYVWDHRVTRTLIFGAAGMVFLLLSFRAVMPAIAKDGLRLGPIGYGLLMAFSGVGSFAAALWVAAGAGGSHRRAHHLFVMVWTACAAVMVVAWTGWIWTSAIAVFVAGFCQVGFMASANTTVQERVPDALRARVMGIWALIFGAAFPVGTLLMGVAAERFDTSWAITGGVVLALPLSVFVFVRVSRRSAVAARDEVREADQQVR